MSVALNYMATVKVVACAQCGGPIALANESQLRETGRTFYCPQQHPNVFVKDATETERLKADLAREKQRREMAEATAAAEAKRAAKAERAHDRTKKRIAAGVCTCCNRTFQDLARHMKTKHPEAQP